MTSRVVESNLNRGAAIFICRPPFGDVQNIRETLPANGSPPPQQAEPE